MRSGHAAVGSLLALALLTGCGLSAGSPTGVTGPPADAWSGERGTTGGPGTGRDSDEEPLDAEKLEAALLRPAHLGRDFVAVPDEEGDGDSDLGCLLTAFEALTGDEDDDTEGGDDEDDDTVEGSWAPRAEPQLPFVGQILVPVGGKEAAQGITAIGESFADCTEIDTVDDDGARLRLDVTTDTESSGGADTQVNVVAAGTMTVGSLEVPFLFEIRMASVDGTVVAVFLGNMSGPGPAGGALMDAAVARLAAVLAGRDPDTPRGLLEDALPDFGAAQA